MRPLSFLALVLLASTAHAASPSPPIEAPHSIVLVACRVDDLTGQRGRHGVDEDGTYHPEMAALNWRDYELHADKGGDFECKRELLDNLEDATQFAPNAPRDIVPLHPDFADTAQCGNVGAVMAEQYNASHKGWAVVAVGCPVRIGIDADGDGKPDIGPDGQYITKGWKLPDCPSHLPGHDDMPMHCKFDASQI